MIWDKKSRKWTKSTRKRPKSTNCWERKTGFLWY